MARSAEDCALLLTALCGPDLDRDSTSLDIPAEDYSLRLDDSIQGLRIGLPDEFWGPGLAPDVRVAIEQALAVLQDLGAEVVPVKLPRTELSIPVYYILAPAEASSNLSRFDGVKFGHRAADPVDLIDMYRRSRSEGFGEEVQRRIMTGTYVLSHGYYDAYYLQAQRLRRMIADDFRAAFDSQCDLILGPVTPNVASAIGAQDPHPTAEWLADIYTLSANLAGLPGMSIPCGFAAGASGRALPVGLQMIGNYFDEGRLLAIAHQFQQVTDWHQQFAEIQS